MRNVSKIRQHVHDLRVKANATIEEYKKFRASLKSTGNNRNEVEKVDKAIADVSGIIARANESLQGANSCFSAIMRVACCLWNVDSGGEWNHKSVKARLDEHGKNCTEAHNISIILNNSAENVGTMDLTKWKNKTLNVLEETYKVIKSDTSRHHWSARDDDKRLWTSRAQ
ncbi:hypothetical protein ERJ75_001637600 [Trypanosoma vivax]|nr:hypothetical protein ERJ75_001695700 [Trypanosoma vivax]KAH8604672.1 hypothetical protein ERJ75_001694900 [Trypanosoma vivax]KAH8605230.1 hypothetical protein ERJ75_001638200 [Trypanosoma vivax]KAH8605233.1 hypothetical protein ERJ75_001637600 [Trypanosoma vivax]